MVSAIFSGKYTTFVTIHSPLYFFQRREDVQSNHSIQPTRSAILTMSTIFRLPRALTRLNQTIRTPRTPQQTPFQHAQPLQARTLTSTPPLRKAQGYGDGEGDPRGENPQDQGASSDLKQNAEHPGPAPPSEGQGKGAGPTKGGANTSSKTAAEGKEAGKDAKGGKNPEDASAQSGGSRSKEAKETGSSPTGGEIGGGSAGTNGGENSQGATAAQPKIHNKNHAPQEGSEEQKAEVEKHNREFEMRHDRAQKAGDDKVDKKFWKG